MKDDDEQEVPERSKSKRSRIKCSRSKRNTKRFYCIVDNEIRARKTGVKGPKATTV